LKLSGICLITVQLIGEVSFLYFSAPAFAIILPPPANLMPRLDLNWFFQTSLFCDSISERDLATRSQVSSGVFSIGLFSLSRSLYFPASPPHTSKEMFCLNIESTYD